MVRRNRWFRLTGFYQAHGWGFRLAGCCKRWTDECDDPPGPWLGLPVGRLLHGQGVGHTIQWRILGRQTPAMTRNPPVPSHAAHPPP